MGIRVETPIPEEAVPEVVENVLVHYMWCDDGNGNVESKW